MLTTEILPKALIGVILTERQYRKVPQASLIKGKSIVVNAVGRMYLYMGDDHRKEIPAQIIVNDFCGNLAFLSIEAKCAIELVYEDDWLKK
jgi:hypothetical protein